MIFNFILPKNLRKLYMEWNSTEFFTTKPLPEECATQLRRTFCPNKPFYRIRRAAKRKGGSSLESNPSTNARAKIYPATWNISRCYPKLGEEISRVSEKATVTTTNLTENGTTFLGIWYPAMTVSLCNVLPLPNTTGFNLEKTDSETNRASVLCTLAFLSHKL